MVTFNGIDFAYDPKVIFKADDQWTQGREPVLRRMPDGSLICLVYSGGPREPHADNLVLIIRSNDDGETWSEPEVLFSHKSRSVWGTEIFTEGERVIAFFQTFEVGGHYSELRAFMSFSDDSGKNWTEPVTVPGCPPNFAVRQGKLLSNGDWLFPVYWCEQGGQFDWESNGKWLPECDRSKWLFRSGVIRSANKGKSFSIHGYLKNDGNAWEPEAIELEDGHLLMYVRSEGLGVLWQTESFDYGVTWSELKPTDIPNHGTKVVMYRVKDSIVLLNNPDEKPGRRHLELWVSKDNCKTWGKKLKLARVPDEVPMPEDHNKNFTAIPWICYPHGFADFEQEIMYVACDSLDMHYLLKIPFADFLG